MFYGQTQQWIAFHKTKSCGLLSCFKANLGVAIS
jgi:hypothetical protein